MPLIKPLTELEQDLVAMRDDVLAVAEATNNLAATIKNRAERFWQQPTERLLAVLNADTQSSLSILQAQATLATIVNNSLDQLAATQYSARAPIETRADVTFDGSAFVFIAPVTQPEEPITQP